MRSMVRMTGIAKKTVMRLVAEVGAFCLEYQDRHSRTSFAGGARLTRNGALFTLRKRTLQRRSPRGNQAAGDAWLWVASDADTKLVPCWTIGPRDAGTAHDFMVDLAARLNHRVQLTTDGLTLYLEAVDYAFGGYVDYAMLAKVYGSETEGEKRYSPAVCISCETKLQSLPAQVELLRFSTFM